MNWRGLLLICLGLVAPVIAADNVAGGATGLQGDVVFTQYSPLSGSAELGRRLVSPLNARRLQQQAAATGTAIREQPIDLAQERFALYVPAQEPPDGYALMVFVPPWNEAKVPPEWVPTLQKQGVILVTAANIGNDANVLDRREPVALLAAYNTMSHYRVDPRRVYVGGFSGGSRVALRLALGYPDLFRGVLLDAGSDVIGAQIPLPPKDLLYQFQSSTRVVYLTGQRDAFHQDTDRESRRSLQTWCLTDIDTQTMPWTGHELADAASLSRALTSLDTHAKVDTNQLATCRARIDHELALQWDLAAHLIDTNDIDGARKWLMKIDTRYGGLAAPRSVELDARLDVSHGK